jgi:hypothetical protein
LGPNYFCYVVYFHSQLRVLMAYYTKTGRFRPLIAWSSQFTTKIGGKTSLGPNYFCYVVYFHSQLRVLMPYYTKTGRFRPLIAWLCG